MADLTGSTKIQGTPTQCLVYLYKAETGLMLASTLSDATTGDYTFSNVPTGTNLNVGCVPVDMNSGIVPQMSGPFYFEGPAASDVTSGYLFLTASSSGSHYAEDYDVTATQGANWIEYFDQTKDISGNLRYSQGNGGTSSLPWLSTVYPGFNLNWTLRLYANNGCWSGDKADFTYEFLDGNDNVVCALKGEPDGNYRNGLWYGSDLNNLVKAGQTGSYPRTNGHLTFTTNQLIFTNLSGTNYNNNFTFSCDMMNVVKIRGNLQSASNYTSNNGCSGAGYLRVEQP